MDPPADSSSSASTLARCCKCGYRCYLNATSLEGPWVRSVKRKHDEYVEGNRFQIPGSELPIPNVARIEIGNECDALRDMVSNKQFLIDELSVELDEERNASSTAANEAMSMILRLQREKAEVQMEAKQFKRFAEEKMSHDAEAISAYEEMLYKRDQAIQSLTCELQAYKHRMMSFGLSESEAEGLAVDYSQNQSFDGSGNPAESPPPAYPPLKCNLNETRQPSEYDEDAADIEKYPFGETPRGQDQLKDLEFRLNQLEKSPRLYPLEGDSSGYKNVPEKVIVGHTPRRARHMASFFPYGPEFGTESPRVGNASFKKKDCVVEKLRRCDDASDFEDDMSDRVYTIDSIHPRTPFKHATDPNKFASGFCDDYANTPRGSLHRGDGGDSDVKKMYLRLHALEADRESLRQTIMSLQTDKAQLVLLREIAQHLCKDMSTEKRMPVQKTSFIRTFSFVTAFKWVLSFFWRKKARQCKYSFGLSAYNVGLLCLLEREPCPRRWRCIDSIQVGRRNGAIDFLREATNL